MAILIDRQRRLVEVGVIRVGDPKQGNAPGRPRKTFRITSRHQALLEAAQKAYGGELRAWKGRPGEWELLTDQPTLKALFSTRPLPSGDLESLSRWYEQWAGNTCTHRCDGSQCQVWKQTGEQRGKPVHERVVKPCSCDPHNPRCKLVSRVSVILTEVPAIGLWRLNTGSVTFDQEVQSLVDTIADLGLPSPVPVTLTITTREKRTGPDQDTERFPVVEILLDHQPVSLPALVGRIRQQALSLPQSLGDVPAALPASVESESPEPPALPPPAALDQSTYNEDQDWLIETLGGEGQARDFRAWCEAEGIDSGALIQRARSRTDVTAERLWKAAQDVKEKVQNGK